MEKEGYAVVAAMTKCEHITAVREKLIFTDHANLMFIFDLFGTNPSVGRHVAHKLMRWAIRLSSYRNVIEHVSGEHNVWSDMLMRWAASPARKNTIKLSALYAPIRSSPPQTDWPRKDDTRKSQERA